MSKCSNTSYFYFYCRVSFGMFLEHLVLFQDIHPAFFEIFYSLFFSLLKIIHLSFKLVARKYERGCVHFHKKHTVLGDKFDDKFVIKE